MKKTSLLVLSFAALSLNAGSIEIGPESVHAPSRLAGSSVSFDEGSFYVTQGAQTEKVEAYNVDESLRGISGINLTTFLNHGYLKLNQTNEGEYTLTGNIRVLGGGWLDDLTKTIVKPQPIPTVSIKIKIPPIVVTIPISTPSIPGGIIYIKKK